MNVIFNNDWDERLKVEYTKEYFQRLQKYLEVEYNDHEVYPKQADIFRAFVLTSYENTKVVILGQDPYHGEGQAHGLSFSVQKDVKIPPSLKNIYRELEDDLGFPIPAHGNLVSWAKQGVLLLNTVLTVRAGAPNSHKGIGWETFTDHTISLLNERNRPIVFVLWGKHAAAKKTLITNKHHAVIEAPHPSPFSARKGFFGSQPFSKTNSFLQQIGEQKIDWEIC